jgi:2-C-methyl-D-erythritol 4-phosphate cytidylyltransferase
VSKGVVLAVAAARLGDVELGADAVVAGGSSRSDSVRAALSAVPEDADVIVVHDAARPLASAWLFEQVVSAVVEGVDGAVPALAISDTVKRVRGSEILETLDRRDLVTVQTPQAFRGEALRKAHAAGTEATDDAGLVEAAGGRIVLVAGDPANVKLTRPADLEGVRRAVELLKDAVQPGQQ